MNTFCLVLAALLPATQPLLAQQPPYAYRLTEPDQELDGFSGKYVGSNKISARLRGVRGADSTLYWVSPDSRQLTAYKRGQRLWQANVCQPFSHLLADAKVNKLALSSHVIFVSITQGGHAEIDRTTGKVSAVGIDKD